MCYWLWKGTFSFPSLLTNWRLYNVNQNTINPPFLCLRDQANSPFLSDCRIPVLMCTTGIQLKWAQYDFKWKKNTVGNTWQEKKVHVSSFLDEHLHYGLNSLSQALGTFYSSVRCWAILTSRIISGRAGSLQPVINAQERRSCSSAPLFSSFLLFQEKINQQKQGEYLLLSEA